MKYSKTIQIIASLCFSLLVISIEQTMGQASNINNLLMSDSIYNTAIPPLYSNAGNDTGFCSIDGTEEFFLGGNPSATGGIPPYTYTWSCNYSTNIANFTFNQTASSFLNDTTIANPQIISVVETNDSVMFHLTVTDSEGNSSSDSVLIHFCTFYMISHIDVNIQKGDSAHIFASVSTDCPAATYKWSPDYNISDVNSANPMVWPDSSLIYSVEISYYAGCVYYDVCQVNVAPANSVNDLSGQIDIEVYPNPVSDELFIIFNKPLMLSEHYIYIYDSTGKVTLTYYLTQNKNHYQIDLSALMPGIYYYKIKNDKTSIKAGRFLIKRHE
jgi:hypothetical protein